MYPGEKVALAGHYAADQLMIGKVGEIREAKLTEHYQIAYHLTLCCCDQHSLRWNFVHLVFKHADSHNVTKIRRRQTRRLEIQMPHLFCHLGPPNSRQYFKIWNERDFQEIRISEYFRCANVLSYQLVDTSLKILPPASSKVIHRHFHQLLPLASFRTEHQVLSYGKPPQSDEV
jgi:hypothetical protein